MLKYSKITVCLVHSFKVDNPVNNPTIIPWIFRFLIGLERRIKIADTSPNTILLLELVELNTRIIMRKMRVLSNLLTPLGPCDPCMGVDGSSVGGVATLEADSSKIQDGVLRGLWKPKICKFWVKPKRTRKGMCNICILKLIWCKVKNI